MRKLDSNQESKGKIREAVQLGQVLERRLGAYGESAKATALGWDKSMLAASAASLSGLVVLTSLASQAEIVYTPTHQVLHRQRRGTSNLNIDLNQDGVDDFTLYAWQASDFTYRVALYEGIGVFGRGASNQVMSTSKAFWVAALPFGAKVGGDAKFGSQERMEFCSEISFQGGSTGPWRNVSNRYLGLKFMINGETHYGWMRLSSTGQCSVTLTLTGYAYETVPDRPLAAGVLPFANQSKLDKASPRPATLGSLALGAAGMALRRGVE